VCWARRRVFVPRRGQDVPDGLKTVLGRSEDDVKMVFSRTSLDLVRNMLNAGRELDRLQGDTIGTPHQYIEHTRHHLAAVPP